MSRFNNPKQLPTLPAARPPNGMDAQFRPIPLAATPLPRATRPPAVATLGATDARSNIMQATCFTVLCLYLLSCYANEFAFRLFSGKAYISTVTVVLLPICWIGTGAALRGLQFSMGKWFLAFGVWLGVCVPLSIWKSNAASTAANYYFRCFLLYFAICACVVTLGR